MGAINEEPGCRDVQIVSKTMEFDEQAIQLNEQAMAGTIASLNLSIPILMNAQEFGFKASGR